MLRLNYNLYVCKHVYFQISFLNSVFVYHRKGGQIHFNVIKVQKKLDFLHHQLRYEFQNFMTGWKMVLAGKDFMHLLATPFPSNQQA